MSKKTVVVWRFDLDHDGSTRKKTIMRIEPRYLQTVVIREGLYKEIKYSLTDDGVKYYEGKYKDWNPQSKGYYRFEILTRADILRHVEECKQKIKEFESVISVLEDPNNINI